MWRLSHLERESVRDGLRADLSLRANLELTNDLFEARDLRCRLLAGRSQFLRVSRVLLRDFVELGNTGVDLSDALRLLAACVCDLREEFVDLTRAIHDGSE